MELEAEIGEFPGVDEVAVIGVPAEMGEEDVVAYVVPEGPDLDPAALHEFCRGRMPAFMVPRYVAVATRCRRRRPRRCASRSCASPGIPPRPGTEPTGSSITDTVSGKGRLTTRPSAGWYGKDI
jgi:crotonobetaine/carnitine-CoA ligase